MHAPYKRSTLQIPNDRKAWKILTKKKRDEQEFQFNIHNKIDMRKQNVWVWCAIEQNSEMNGLVLGCMVVTFSHLTHLSTHANTIRFHLALLSQNRLLVCVSSVLAHLTFLAGPHPPVAGIWLVLTPLSAITGNTLGAGIRHHVVVAAASAAAAELMTAVEALVLKSKAGVTRRS